MYYFTSDYTEGGAPEILAALSATNFEQTGGYGIDPYCEAAAILIKKRLTSYLDVSLFPSA